MHRYREVGLVGGKWLCGPALNDPNRTRSGESSKENTILFEDEKGRSAKMAGRDGFFSRWRCPHCYRILLPIFVLAWYGKASSEFLDI